MLVRQKDSGVCVLLKGKSGVGGFASYQQGVAASHDAEAQARAALTDLDGGLTAGDDGTGRRVTGQSGRG